MSDLDTSSDFTTSILTSKTPEQSASLVNEGVRHTSDLANRLIQFFEAYINCLQKQNYELKNLVSSQAVPLSSYLNSQKEAGLIPSIWDHYLQSLHLNISSNDHLIKFLKLHMVSPLVNMINNDIKYSELVINNQELTELASGNPIDEYRWNSKSLQVLENFKNFKQNEKSLVVGSLIDLFNTTGADGAKLQAANENSLKFILSNFNINNEMDNYLNVLLGATYPPLLKTSAGSLHGASHLGSGKTKKEKANRNSKLLHSEKEKKEKVKLRSRVGSIFGGRKRKGKTSTDLESIYSNQTASTNLTHLTNLREDEVVQSSDRAVSAAQAPRRTSFAPSEATSAAPVAPVTPVAPVAPVAPVRQQPVESAPSSHEASYQAPTYSPPSTLAPAQDPYQPAAPRQTSSSSNPNRDLPILPSPFSPEPEEVEPDVPKSPNVVKYSDDSSDEDENKPSMLQQNSLDLPPQVASNNDYLSMNKSRHTQYSFESGDDLKNFQTSPKVQRSEKFELPEPDVKDSEEAADGLSSLPNGFAITNGQPTNGQSTNGPIGASSPSRSAAPAPAPPPARRVAHPGRSEIQSQIFHSLPNTRESVIEPPHPIQPPLSSQVTGSSLASTANKHDLFNHNELISNLIPGLNLSNSQVINVNFQSDILNKSSIIGELAFNYQGNSSSALQVRIPNKFDKVMLNNTFVERLDDEVFEINPALVLNKTLGGIKYIEQSLDIDQIPVFVHSIWKFEDHQASLMINVKLNPNFTSSIVLNNLVVSVALKSDTEATSASSRPTGTFNKDKNRITWRFTQPVNLTEENPDEKLIARFMTNGKAAEDNSGIQLKFSVFNHIQNTITCNGQLVNCISNLNAGNYTSNS